jgi:hypothetical protein
LCKKEKYMGKVLILGNGFDLDLGFKTKYKDFLESKYFPSSEDSIHGGLIEHIRQASLNQTMV